MSDDDKIKKSLSYEPDISYEEDYYSDHKSYDQISTESEYINPLHDDNNYDDAIMQNIQNNIDFLVQLISNLPLELQTPINQVFKPVFLDWNKNLKKQKYPIVIPEPIITIKKERKPIEVKPEDIIRRPDPVPIVPDSRNVDPIDDDPIDDDLIDDGLFEPSAPIDIEYVISDPIEIIKAEFVKNLVDLYNLYTNKLKDTILPYYLHLTTMLMHSKTDSEVQFAYGRINMDNCNVSADSRHLMDMSLRSEVTGQMKLSFFENFFSLESTIYHINNFTTMYKFRLRYAQENKSTGADSLSSINNRILNGMSEMYDAKYDNAYINLYKYLTSSNNVLGDTFSTMTSGMVSKDAVIRKKEIKDVPKEETTETDNPEEEIGD